MLLLLALAAALIVAALLFILPNACAKTTVQSTPAYPAALAGTDVANAGAVDGPQAYTSQFTQTDAESAKVEMPDVTGQPLAQAKKQLEQLGLVVESAASGYDASKADSTVLTQSKQPGEWALTEDHVALTYNALPMTLNVFGFAPHEGRITLGNLIAVCKMLDTTNPTFSFSIVIHAQEEYELKGGFRCLTGEGEETPIARVNTQLLREGKAIKGLVADNAYDDSIGWTIALDDWTGFHFDHVTGYDVTVTSREDESLQLKRSYSPDETKSMTLLDCGFDGGRVRLDVTGQKQWIIRLTDEALAAGYPNSVQGKGDKAPVWEVKLPIDSYRWIEAVIDGMDGQSIDAMQAEGLKFLYSKTTAKDKKPSSFDGVSYKVDGDTLVIAVTVPDADEFRVYDIAWLELSLYDGAYQFKTRIR